MRTNKLSFVGALVATLFALTACAATPTERSTGQAVDDTVLLGKVKTSLIQSPDTKARDIDVEVYKGAVQLNGFVESESQKMHATEVAAKVEGVKSVRNNLQVQPEARTAGVAIDDGVITAKVKAALIGDARTKAYEIEVSTNHGQVQLGGFVDSKSAKQAATEVAMTVKGVRSVNNELEVKA